MFRLGGYAENPSAEQMASAVALSA